VQQILFTWLSFDTTQFSFAKSVTSILQSVQHDCSHSSTQI